MPNIQSVKEDNDVLTRIIKYIPAEMITLYASAVAILSNGETEGCRNAGVFKWLVIALIVLTPVWKYLSVKDNPDPFGGSSVKAAIFHAVIAMISLCMYVYVSANPLLKCWIGEALFNPLAGAVVLLIFSIAIVPLLEKLFLKKIPIPPAPEIK